MISILIGLTLEEFSTSYLNVILKTLFKKTYKKIWPHKIFFLRFLRKRRRRRHSRVIH